MSISENSRRIAKNTVFLYARMLLLMFIGLFTSRVVLNSLGVDDYGIYGAVGGVVMMFTIVTNSISQAIVRYLTFELGKEDKSRLRSIFSTAVVMQFIFCGVLLLFVETAGLWWLNCHMNIPDGRLEAANWVLQCSMGLLMVSLLSVPFNAAIIAHEKMKAFAGISILEAVLKLAVALLIMLSKHDRLKLYAVLMLVVSVLIRFTYGAYCHRHFQESRGPLKAEPALMKEMLGFAGWNVLGSGAYIVNTQGVNLLVNSFFGVGMNAARLVAVQVENVVKQFVSNLLTAINPQITKSYASGSRDYCYELVSKGVKFSFLLILFFAIPFMSETHFLLELWLKRVPEGAVTFTRLAMLCLMADMVFNPMLTLIQADGRIKVYYIVSSAVSLLVFVLSWAAFAMGAQAYVSYIVFAVVYSAVDVIKLSSARRLAGFPVGGFLRETVSKLLALTLIACILPLVCLLVLPEGWLRLVLVLLCTVVGMVLPAYFIVLTEGEREFVFRKIGRFLPDRLYLKLRYRYAFGQRLNLKNPLRYTEKLQWLKLYERKPIYSTLVDKKAAKQYVEERIGKDYVVPILGTWDRAADIDFESLPERFVIKCNHDSGSACICQSKSALDENAVRARLDKALRTNFYRRDREWPYKNVKPCIIAEEYLGDNIPDYKFFCFDGKPEFMFTATDRGSEGETRFDFFDMDYHHLDLRNGHPNADVLPPVPEHWEEMKRLAATLSAGIPHVRVDFYDVDGKLYFGEFTLFHWSGLVPFEPDEWDFKFGAMLKLPRK